MFRSRPLAFADDRETRAVNDEVNRFAVENSTEFDVELQAATRKRRVVGCTQVNAAARPVGRQVSASSRRWRPETSIR